jgi:hypothetical protein
MTPALRKLALATHITCSVGWGGAAVVFLALAIIAVTSRDELTVRGAYAVMEPAAWLALLPLAHASLLTGIVVSLGTTWGLFRHYWVVLKLAITVFATVVLLIYMETFRQMGRVAADPGIDLGMVRNPSPMVHAILALLLLLAATALGVYKPLGMTAYGRRKHAQERGEVSRTSSPGRGAALARPRTRTPRWVYLSGIVAICVILLFVILHLVSGGR